MVLSNNPAEPQAPTSSNATDHANTNNPSIAGSSALSGPPDDPLKRKREDEDSESPEEDPESPEAAILTLTFSINRLRENEHLWNYPEIATAKASGSALDQTTPSNKPTDKQDEKTQQASIAPVEKPGPTSDLKELYKKRDAAKARVDQMLKNEEIRHPFIPQDGVHLQLGQRTEQTFEQYGKPHRNVWEGELDANGIVRPVLKSTGFTLVCKIAMSCVKTLENK